MSTKIKIKNKLEGNKKNFIWRLNWKEEKLKESGSNWKKNIP
jgi:hypothetical protein